jgi:hypothetical protein
MPLELLLDADAFLALRKLSLLEAMTAAGAGRMRMRMAEYTARHELSTIDQLLRALEAQGRLSVHGIVRRTDADRLYRALVRDGADKGEAEAVAWAVQFGSEELVFVAVDHGARKVAGRHNILAADVMDLCVLLVEGAHVSADLVRSKLSPWLDREQQVGRPHDLAPFDFDDAYEKRRHRWNAASLVSATMRE